MIGWAELYKVLSALNPLYAAMFAGYGTVKYNVFRAEDVGGVSRFVSVIAVPFLSFEMIKKINPYNMNMNFFYADVASKMISLTLLSLWANMTAVGSLEWVATAFSLSALPNTLVIGVPLMTAMYGTFTSTLMVQIVVTQGLVWYTLLLIMYEYGSARRLVRERFPDTANSISSFQVQPDVVSLADDRQLLHTYTHVMPDGTIHVTIRRSDLAWPPPPTHPPRPAPAGDGFESWHHSMSSRHLRSGSLSTFHADPEAPVPVTAHWDEEMYRQQKLQEQEQCQDLHLGSDDALHGKGRRAAAAASSGGEVHLFVPISMSSTGADPSALEHNPNKQTSNKFSDILLTKGGKSLNTAVDRNSPGAAFEIQPELSKQTGRDNTKMPKKAMLVLITKMVSRKLIRNPNIHASVLGIVWALISFKWNITMPDVVESSITILSNTGLGMSMFSLGMFMGLKNRLIACGWKLTIIGMALRFILGPATMAAGSVVMGLRGVLLDVSVVQAALPMGIVPFVFAREYDVYPDVLSTSVIFGMIISLPVAVGYYAILS